MASMTELGGDRYSIRWRESLGGRRRARQLTVKSRHVAEVVLRKVEDDLSLHGFYRGPSRQTKHRKERASGFVYFIEAADRIKIGFAEDPAKRLVELRCGCPVEMTLLLAIPGTTQDEAGWHREFKADRVHGEWFEKSPALQAKIAVCGLVRGDDRGTPGNAV